MSGTSMGKWAAYITLSLVGVGAIGVIMNPGEPELNLRSSPSARSFASVPAESPSPSPSASSSPMQAAQEAAGVSGSAGSAVVKKVVVTQRLSYGKRTIEDSSLATGTTKVTKGRVGYRVKTYEYRYQNGQLIKRTLLSSEVTRIPVDQITRVGTTSPKPPPGTGSGDCDPNYSGCVPIASDVDCAGGSGNGPEYVSGPVRVIGSDIYDLDGDDNDGIGCE